MWDRTTALDWALRFADLATGLRERREPMDADAAIVAEVGEEIARAATSASWPPTRGKVLGWAHRISAVAAHLTESEAGLDATAALLTGVAKGLQRVAPELRSTQEIRAITDEPDDDFDSAETQPIYPLKAPPKPTPEPEE